MDDLEVQRRRSKGLQVGLVEAGVVDARHDLAHKRRNCLEQVRCGVVADAEAKRDAALLQPLEVADAARQQITIGHHHLLARQAADACGLHADMLDRAGNVADDDEVADHEGLVEGDRQRREQIAEDVPYRQRGGAGAVWLARGGPPREPESHRLACPQACL